MSESNFREDEMRGIIIAIFMFVVMTFILFSGGVLADSAGQPPKMNTSALNFSLQDEKPEVPTGKIEIDGKEATVPDGELYVVADAGWLTKVWLRIASWDPDSQTAVVCVNQKYLPCEVGDDDAKTVYFDNSEITEWETDSGLNVSVTGLRHVENVGGDGSPLNWNGNTDDSLVFKINAGGATSSGFFDGFLYIGDIITWYLVFVIGFVIKAVGAILIGLGFIANMFVFLVTAVTTTIGLVYDYNAFLGAVIGIVQVGLSLYIFNGTMKIVKAIPFT